MTDTRTIRDAAIDIIEGDRRRYAKMIEAGDKSRSLAEIRAYLDRLIARLMTDAWTPDRRTLAAVCEWLEDAAEHRDFGAEDAASHALEAAALNLRNGGLDGIKPVDPTIDEAASIVRGMVDSPPVDTVQVPRRLTAENGAKAALMGEFRVDLPDFDEDGKEYVRRVNVPWTVIKDIHKRMVELVDRGVVKT